MTKQRFIRQFAAILLGCLWGAQLYAQQHTTEFLFTETAPDDVRQTMQANAKALFAEINRAYDQNKQGLTLSGSNLTKEAIERIQTLWAVSHFYCTETSITARVLKSIDKNSKAIKYQVRNIPVYFAEGETDEDKYQGMVIEFTLSGQISDLYNAIAQTQYDKIWEKSNDVTDKRRRQMILEFVENFRTAYNTKDLSYLDKVYSEDALIITGKVRPADDAIDLDKPQVMDSKKVNLEYSVQDKRTYLANLKRAFNRNAYINIKFDNIVVTQLTGNPGIYGVLLIQSWNSSTYSDKGWLFLIIDFKDEDNPLIWVRTWQPLKDKNGEDVHYDYDEVFNLSDFIFK